MYYKFLVEYECLSDDLYRVIALSRDCSLEELGFIVLSTFDTSGVHDFTFSFRNTDFAKVPFLKIETSEERSPAKTTLRSLHLKRGMIIYMYYDLVRDQTFKIKFLGAFNDIEDCELPKIVEGRGKGILEEISSNEFFSIVKKMEREGYSEEFYRSLDSEDYVLWDIRDYSLKEDNRRLKERTERFSKFYGFTK